MSFWWIFGIIVVLGLAGLVWYRSSTTMTTTVHAGTTAPPFDWSLLKKSWPILVILLLVGAVFYFLQNGGIDGDWSSFKLEGWKKNLALAVMAGVVIWLIFKMGMTGVVALGFLGLVAYFLLSQAGCFKHHTESGFITDEVLERKLYEFSVHGDEVRINVPEGYKPHFYPKGGQTKNCPPKGNCYTDTPGVDSYPKVEENNGMWTITKASEGATGVEIWLEPN